MSIFKNQWKKSQNVWKMPLLALKIVWKDAWKTFPTRVEKKLYFFLLKSMKFFVRGVCKSQRILHVCKTGCIILRVYNHVIFRTFELESVCNIQVSCVHTNVCLYIRMKMLSARKIRDQTEAVSSIRIYKRYVEYGCEKKSFSLYSNIFSLFFQWIDRKREFMILILFHFI